MGSSRLPGKVLLDIAGQPMLARVVERTRRAKTIDTVVVATTTDLADDPVAEFCETQGYASSRGSLHDVLDRYYQTARQFKAAVVVRITADCPMIDPDVIDHTVNEFFRTGVDFAANRLPPPWGRSYPIGLDTEVCTFAALEQAWKKASEPHQREHVMPYLYEQEGRFKVLLVNHDPDYSMFRWTVDTAEDLEFIRQVYARFEGKDDFSWLEVLAVIEREPGLVTINAGVKHKGLHDIDERRNNY